MPPEHPDNVYVPLGECRGCGTRTFLDGTPNDLRVRPHNTQDPVTRKRHEEVALKAGKRYVDYPNCSGSKKKPVEGSVSFPLVSFGRG